MAFITLVIGAAGVNTFAAALVLSALFDLDQFYAGLLCLAGFGLMWLAITAHEKLGKLIGRRRHGHGA